jgi:hypothetical protein
MCDCTTSTTRVMLTPKASRDGPMAGDRRGGLAVAFPKRLGTHVARGDERGSQLGVFNVVEVGNARSTRSKSSGSSSPGSHSRRQRPPHRRDHPGTPDASIGAPRRGLRPDSYGCAFCACLHGDASRECSYISPILFSTSGSDGFRRPIRTGSYSRPPQRGGAAMARPLRSERVAGLPAARPGARR